MEETNNQPFYGLFNPLIVLSLTTSPNKSRESLIRPMPFTLFSFSLSFRSLYKQPLETNYPSLLDGSEWQGLLNTKKFDI